MREACGLFGIYAPKENTAKITYFGLHALQHRGQESSGMAVSDGRQIKLHKKMGLVSQVYNESILEKLKGKIVIGHNRYGTSGSSSLINAQPMVLNTNIGTMAIAHNGNLTNVVQLKKKLFSKRESFVTNSDSEIIAKLIAQAPGKTWRSKILNGVKELSGAYSLLILTKNKLFALRDPLGVRPLILGKLNSGYVFASESAALFSVGSRPIKELDPGEAVVVDEKGYRTINTAKSKKALFVFLNIFTSAGRIQF